MITRMGKTHYLDGRVTGVQFTNEDHFVLDGQVLIPISGANGAHGTEYRTENESFVRVFSYGQNANGPAYFYVYTKDGKKMLYGWEDNAFVKIPGQPTPLSYALLQVEDVNFNYMEFIYNNNPATGDFNLSRINYADNPYGTNANNYVLFEYQNYTFAPYYSQGNRLQRTQRLQRIKTFAEGSLVENYELEYSLDEFNNRFYLSKLTEKNAVGESFNSTLFTMEPKTPEPGQSRVDAQSWTSYFGKEYSTSNFTGNKGLLDTDKDKQEVLFYQRFVGDINGDGIPDICSYSSNYMYNKSFLGVLSKKEYRNKLFFGISRGDGTFHEHENATLPFGNLEHGNFQMMLIDINRDGKADLVLLDNRGIYVALSAGRDSLGGFGMGTKWADNSFYDNERFANEGWYWDNKVGYRNLVQFADMDADGLLDIVKFYSTGVYVHLNKGDRFENANFYTTQVNLDPNKRYLIADVNGDNLPDIIILHQGSSGKIEVALSTGTSFQNPIEMGTGFQYFDNKKNPISMVDVNGDGLADIVGFVGNNMYLAISTGKSFEYKGLVHNLGNLVLRFDDNGICRSPSYFIDVNNDGLTDIVTVAVDNLYVNLNKGNEQWQAKGVGIYGFSNWGNAHSFGDFNGDGTLDFIQFGDNETRLKMGVVYSPANKLQSVTDGFENKTEVSYIYNRPQLKPKDLVYPYTNLGAPAYLANIIISSNSLTNKRIVESYGFENPVTHFKGKGFLGFRKIGHANWTIGECQLKNFKLNGYNDYIYGLEPTNDSIMDSEGKFTKIDYYYEYGLYGNKRYWQKLLGVYKIIPLNSSEKLFNNTYPNYDANGNNITLVDYYFKQKADGTREASAFQATEVTTTFEQYSTWIFRPTKVVTKKYNNQYGWITNTNAFTYSGKNLTEKITEPDNTPYKVIERYSNFTTYGQPTTVSIIPTQGVGSTINNIYESKGRFLTQSTNALNHITKYEYEPKFGNLKKITDPNGLSTNYYYDNWGRLIQTVTPDNVIKNYALKWTTQAATNVTGALYCSQETLSDEYPTEVHYDALGRKVESIFYTASEITNGSYSRSRIRTEYDNLGRISKTSAPFKDNNSPSLWTTFTYDILSRIKTEKGTYIDKEYTYGIRTVIETDKLNSNTTFTKKFNELGQLIEATDPGGTITYTYDAKGLPKTIKANNQITTMTYDIMGNRTQISDPNAGITNSEYNSLGQMIKQTNARNQYTTFTYDNLGRNLTKWVNGSNTTEGSATYSYDSGNKALGQISSVSGLNHTSSYTYDNFSRLSQRTETIDGRIYATSYGYDAKSRVSKMTYPSGYIINYTYKPSGQLDYVKDASNNPLWRLYYGNIYGLPTQIDFSSGISTLYTYNTSGMLTGIKTHRINTGLNLAQNLEYGYNSRGLLSYRKDIKNTQTEEYYYDNLGRLSEDRRLKGNYLYSNPISYDNMGNIKNQKNVGDYEYASAWHANAVSKLQTPYISYDADCETSYTPFNKAKKLTEDNKSIELFYGNDEVRVKSIHNVGSVTQTNYYVSGDYEEEIKGSNTRKLHYLRANGKVFAILVKETGKVDSVFYVHTDHLGSYDVITDCNMSIKETYAFDVWGYRRKNADWTKYETRTSFLFKRGYTGHEHYDIFDIINMDGRLYDPGIARFFSPDPFVQVPFSTQGFNRYSYCGNNPVNYTDPNGEFYQIAILGFGTLTQGLENMANGVSKPWETAYNDVSQSMDRARGAGQFTIYQYENFSIRAGVDFLAPGVSASATYATENTAISISAGYSFGGPFVGGGFSQKMGDFAIGGGIGAGENYWGWNVNATYKGYGAGYGQTYYGNAIGPDGQSNAQAVGSGTIIWKGGSFTLQNDFLAFSGDKWRTQAAELQIGNYLIGASMYTGDGNAASGGKTDDRPSPIWGQNRPKGEDKLATWKKGQVFSSPFWIGYKNGNTVSRLGFSFSSVQDVQQNGIHKWVPFGRQNFYLDYDHFQQGFYSYSGYYNPYSLYNK